MPDTSLAMGRASMETKRKVKRNLLAAAISSLLALVVVVAIFFRSMVTSDIFVLVTFSNSNFRQYEMDWDNGRAELSYQWNDTAGWTPPNGDLGWHHDVGVPGSRDPWWNSYWYCWEFSSNEWGNSTEYRIGGRLWVTGLLLSVLPIMWLINRTRKPQRGFEPELR